MTQERLNHLMILHVHRPLTELLDLIILLSTVSIGLQYLENLMILILFNNFLTCSYYISNVAIPIGYIKTGPLKNCFLRPCPIC